MKISTVSSLNALLHLESQQVGFRTARGFAIVPPLFVEGVTAFVERIDLRLALVFIV